MTTLHLSHKKMKIVDSKKCQSNVKIKSKTSSNENFISEVHLKFLNIYFLIFKKFK